MLSWRQDGIGTSASFTSFPPAVRWYSLLPVRAGRRPGPRLRGHGPEDGAWADPSARAAASPPPRRPPCSRTWPAVGRWLPRSGLLLPDFFGLMESSIERWAAMQHEPLWMTRWRTTRFAPPAMVGSVARHFGSGCAVWMARLKGEPVAGIVVLSSGAYAKYWRGAMNKQLAGPTRAN